MLKHNWTSDTDEMVWAGWLLPGVSLGTRKGSRAMSARVWMLTSVETGCTPRGKHVDDPPESIGVVAIGGRCQPPDPLSQRSNPANVAPLFRTA